MLHIGKSGDIIAVYFDEGLFELNKMVSVIIPAYNRQAYIQECLESVLSQSYENFEIIIVDDGSSDQTAEICRNMAKQDSRIQLYAGEHKGVSAARNMALEKALGEYLFFLDSDDIIHPRLLEVLVGGMEESGAKIGGTMCFSVKNEVWDRYKPKFIDQSEVQSYDCVSFEDALETTFSRKTPISMIGGVMFSRDWVGATKFRTDLTIGEDFWFIYENLTKGTSVVYLKSWLYLSRLHQQNSSWDYKYSGFMTRFLRKELVWKNEEKCGRQVNADRQKSEVLGTYLRCLKHNRVYSKDCKMMRKTMRKHQKTLLKAMNIRKKIAFLAVVYLPLTGVIVNKRIK